MIFDIAINKLSAKPKQLFLVDGFGALLSAFSLGIVLVRFEKFFGIPVTTLYFLAFLPCLFAVYDFLCFKMKLKNVSIYLRGIAIANLTYCFISIGLAIYHRDIITYLGWTYITLEILILIYLIVLEFRIAQNLTPEIRS